MTKLILTLKNPITEEVKTVHTGFSWAALFFGFLVPIYRKDWKSTLFFTPIYFLTLGLATIPFAFSYNKRYIRFLFEQGNNLFYFRGELNISELENLVVYPTIKRKMKIENLKVL